MSTRCIAVKCEPLQVCLNRSLFVLTSQTVGPLTGRRQRGGGVGSVQPLLTRAEINMLPSPRMFAFTDVFQI